MEEKVDEFNDFSTNEWNDMQHTIKECKDKKERSEYILGKALQCVANNQITKYKRMKDCKEYYDIMTVFKDSVSGVCLIFPCLFVHLHICNHRIGIL